MKPEVVIQETQAWIEAVVIGLNLCPFAAAPFRLGRIHYRCTDTQSPETLLHLLYEELQRLVETDGEALETSFLIHPRALTSLEEQLDFLLAVDGLLYETGLEGAFQVVGFHPDYQFAETPADDPTHYVNRSPYPMLHLLREERISWAAETHPDIHQIPVDNTARLQALGLEGIQQLRATSFQKAPSSQPGEPSAGDSPLEE
ncbi:MAG: DUF1415 domain-containing protein [Bacteroidetes bacterium]|nr:MAG: DUF1415 domain-containing protein [Bacteroidota bacterium]